MDPARPLLGRAIVVVGGTSGIGLSGARALVAAGARIVVTGRSAGKVDAAVEQLRGEGAGAGVGVSGHCGDASDPTAVTEAVAQAVQDFGRLDGLYHVAGGSGRSAGDGALHDVSDEGVDFTIATNLKALIFSNRAAVRQFRAQGGGGVILNTGSVLGYSPSPEFFASHVYAATKAAAIGFTRSIAAYYAREGIRANLIAPALVATPMSQRAAGDEAIMEFVRRKQPLDGGRIGEPEDIDGAAVYLLSDASKFVTGQVLAVDGGWGVSEGR